MSKYDDVQKRMNDDNKSEEAFKALLDNKEINYHNIGFQKQPTKKEWNNLPFLIRNTPDFVVWFNNKPAFYEVKGCDDTFLYKPTAHKNYKKWSEVMELPLIYTICHWSSMYYSGYAFVFVHISRMEEISNDFELEYVKDVWAKKIPINILKEHSIRIVQ